MIWMWHQAVFFQSCILYRPPEKLSEIHPGGNTKIVDPEGISPQLSCTLWCGLKILAEKRMARKEHSHAQQRKSSCQSTETSTRHLDTSVRVREPLTQSLAQSLVSSCSKYITKVYQNNAKHHLIHYLSIPPIYRTHALSTLPNASQNNTTPA